MRRIKLLFLTLVSLICFHATAQEVLFKTNFKDLPVDAGFPSGDMYAATTGNANKETTKGGIIFGAGPNGQRINFAPGQAANQFASGVTAYGSETLDDDGATTGAFSFIKSGSESGGGYIVLPAVKGPAVVSVWNASGVSSSQKTDVWIGENGVFTLLKTITIPGNKVIKKNSFTYEGTGDFQVKFVASSEVTNSNSNLYFYDVLIESTAPPTFPSLSLVSELATATQAVYPSQAIASILYKWGGTANSAAVSWTGTSDVATAPEGIVVENSVDAKTTTISGIPTKGGEYGYTVSVTDGPNTIDLSGTIKVKETTKKRLAYVTTVTNGVAAPLDLPFLTALEEKFDLNLLSATAKGVDYSIYDLIVLSAIPSSASEGLPELKTASLSKPFLNMKTFQMQSTRWDWISGQANTNQTTIVVPDEAKSHPMFDGITFSGDLLNEVLLTTKDSGNRVVKFTSLVDVTTPIILGTAKDETDPALSYVEIPKGTTLKGMTTQTLAPQLIIGLSEAAWDALTPDAIKLVSNAANYLVTPAPVELSITKYRVESGRTVSINQETKTITIKVSNELSSSLYKPYFIDVDTLSLKLEAGSLLVTPALGTILDFASPQTITVKGIVKETQGVATGTYSVAVEPADMRLTDSSYKSQITQNILNEEELPLWVSTPAGLSNPGGDMSTKEGVNVTSETDYTGGYLKAQKVTFALSSCGKFTFKWCSNGGRLPVLKDQTGKNYLTYSANRTAKKLYTESVDINSETPITLTLSFYNGAIDEAKSITGGLYYVAIEPNQSTSIEKGQDVTKRIVSVTYFDMVGKQIAPLTGELCIQKLTYEDGSVGYQKTVKSLIP